MKTSDPRCLTCIDFIRFRPNVGKFGGVAIPKHTGYGLCKMMVEEGEMSERLKLTPEDFTCPSHRERHGDYEWSKDVP